MIVEQREPNPDVNSYNPDDGSVEDPIPTDDSSEKDDGDGVPVPPDFRPVVPIEEPPGSSGPPMGDVDDSPKRIA
jgi:hypothetical protein